MSPAESDSFTFPIWISFIYFFFFSDCCVCLWLPTLSWIKVERDSILILFLILEEMLSAFHCWLWCWLWVFHIWPLLCWGMFPLYPLCWEAFFFNHKCMLNFVKKLFCICWDGHLIFILQFADTVYHIVCFVDIMPSAHSWDKFRLIMIYDSFNVLNSVC